MFLASDLHKFVPASISASICNKTLWVVRLGQNSFNADLFTFSETTLYATVENKMEVGSRNQTGLHENSHIPHCLSGV